MIGDNFTQEYKYPIKLYKIGSIEFANGIEVRKMVFSFILGAIILLSFMLIGVKGDSNILLFFANNWLVILITVPSVITFVVFNLKYDNKKVIPYIRDRYWFYRTKHKEYEHFHEVATNQIKRELTFEAFMKEGEKQ